MTARGTIGTWRARAALTSGLSAATAVLVTSACASPMCGAAWPISTRRPSACSRSVVALSTASDPLTMKPRLCRISAMPLMPAPPMPTKCKR
ncbi:MAG: hypothetical protein QM762_19890 [Chryseolinea sp.]